MTITLVNANILVLVCRLQALFRIITMLKAVRNSFSLKLGSRIFVCLNNRQMPPQLRAKVKPLVVGVFACWADRIKRSQNPA